ncbi:MAG: nucleotide sugar dehydrogenase [Methanotrichaceae archaeon]|nr:nucleotide sugar dehydrogenase [Methanotrichaceae archaeon]
MEDAIAVIGLGNAGLPLAAIIPDNGLSVVGVDIDPERCDLINNGSNPIPEEAGLEELINRYGGNKLLATSDLEDARNCRAFIIIVPLFIDQSYNPDFSLMEKAVRSVGRILKKGDLVSIETTVPPGTTESTIRFWLEESSHMSHGDFFLAHSPERIMTGYSIYRLREFPKILGGIDDESGFIAFNLYNKFIPNLKLVSSARVAEMIKVMEGCYRDVNIYLANELYKISAELGVDFSEARDNANHQYCQLHQPSTGVGGHCIPVYPWFLIKEMEKRELFKHARMLRISREINDDMIFYWAERILLECLKVSKPLDQIKICIKGITFRPNVRELYHSRNLALAKLLKEKGLNVYAFDSHLSKEEVKANGLRYIQPEEADLVFDSFNLSF